MDGSSITTMQVEPIAKCHAEIVCLMDAHGQELTKDKEAKGAPNPDWAQARRLEQIGKFKIVTVRVSGRLAGYLMFVLSHLPNYKHIAFCHEHTYYLAPQYRNPHSRLGYKFCIFADQEMRRFGAAHARSMRSPVCVFSITNKIYADNAAIWHRLGYEDEEIIRTKLVRV
jgi:hypothetical protein